MKTHHPIVIPKRDRDTKPLRATDRADKNTESLPVNKARLLARIVLAALLLYGAVGGLIHFSSFEADLEITRLVPAYLVLFCLVALILIEIVCAVGLFIPLFKDGALEIIK